MTELEILKGMRTLLADPARHCQTVMAMTPYGTACGWRNPDATSFCALGGASKVAGRDVYAYDLQTFRHVILARGYPSIGSYNDETDHARVLSAIDEAIAILEAKQPSTCAAVKKLIDDAVRAAEPVA